MVKIFSYTLKYKEDLKVKLKNGTDGFGRERQKRKSREEIEESSKNIEKTREGLNSGAEASIYLYGARLSRVEAISVIKMRLRKIFEELALAVCGSKSRLLSSGLPGREKIVGTVRVRILLPKLSLNDDFSGVTSEDFEKDEKYFRKINSPWVMYV
ncbi:hypothetical protein CEXT_382101 [Caerostris extrusa]|uniref:Uncharacterized protein n=1 Tax=Caerostris extrusa TaxID=172846 RepID=A0AAV4VGQ6_CAEEX|nr:hypothetical protein CEXT_382101 [Caerostris extrusa]